MKEWWTDLKGPVGGQALLAAVALIWLGLREGREVARAVALKSQLDGVPYAAFFNPGVAAVVEAVLATPDAEVCGVWDELSDYEVQRFSEMLYPKTFLPVAEPEIGPGTLFVRSASAPAAAGDTVLLVAGTLQVCRRGP
jgi:hypothetical protein